MFTLALALLCAVLLGTSWEGTVKMRGVLASCVFLRLGRVRAAAWAYRPERLYIRVRRV